MAGWLAPLLSLVCFVEVARSEPLSALAQVEIVGDVFEDQDISAITRVGKLFVLASDEGGRIQILQHSAGKLHVLRDIPLAVDKPESDFEGLAAEGDTVYAIGSHSRVRKQAKRDKTPEENLERIHDVDREETREVLFRFQLSAAGQATSVERTSLTPELRKSDLLRRFDSIPGKENGIDIEGLTVRDGWLYAGFRGPVLRNNLVPILKFRFGDPILDAQWLFVDLAGDGVRDIAAVEGGFLILAGPVGDRAGSYTIHFWDGQDCLVVQPDENDRAANLQILGEIPAPVGTKPEGLAVLGETATTYELLVVYDGTKLGRPTLFRVEKLKSQKRPE